MSGDCPALPRMLPCRALDWGSAVLAALAKDEERCRTVDVDSDVETAKSDEWTESRCWEAMDEMNSASSCALKQLCREPGRLADMLLDWVNTAHIDCDRPNHPFLQPHMPRPVPPPPAEDGAPAAPAPGVDPGAPGADSGSAQAQADGLSRISSGDATGAAAELGLSLALEHLECAHVLFGTLLRSAPAASVQALPPTRHFLSKGSGKRSWKELWRVHSAAKLPDDTAGDVLLAGSAELSLRDGERPFAFYEYVEEHPFVLNNVGMAHRVLSYFRTAGHDGAGHESAQYDGPQLGPFGAPPQQLMNGQPVPGLLRQQAHLRPGQGLAVMESSLVRAPLVRQQASATDFLMVRYSHRGRESLVLRRIPVACVVGQTEPLVDLQPPGARSNVQRRRRCIRQMVREARRRSRDPDGTKTFEENLVNDVKQWWGPGDVAAIRAECKDIVRQDDVDAAQDPMLPEDVCILEALERGAQRLRRLGVDDRFSADKALRIALEDLVSLEGRRTQLEDPLAPRARWVVDQLQLSPWHLAQQYRGVSGKQRALFALVGLADPSGARGEGVSLLKDVASNIPDILAIAKLQLQSDAELLARLEKLGANMDRLRGLGRWEHIDELHRRVRKGRRADDEDAAQRQNNYQSYRRLLQETFQRQLDALQVQREERPAAAAAAGGPTEGLASPGEDLLNDLMAELGVHAPAENDASSAAGAGSGVGAASVAGSGVGAHSAVTAASVSTAVGAGSGPPLGNHDRVIRGSGMRAASAAGSAAGANGVNTALGVGSGTGTCSAVGHSGPREAAQSEGEDDDAQEMARLRATFSDGKPAPVPPKDTQKQKIPLLRVVTVEKSPLQTWVERTLYVVGEADIRRYREGQRAAAKAASRKRRRAGQAEEPLVRRLARPANDSSSESPGSHARKARGRPSSAAGRRGSKGSNAVAEPMPLMRTRSDNSEPGQSLKIRRLKIS